MAWNRDKWNQFVVNNTAIPPTDAAAKKAVEEAKTAAANHEEDIDLDALGVQRVKEYLADFAATIPGSQGLRGLPSTPTGNTLTLLASDNQSFLGAGGHSFLSYTFAPGTLDGAKDLIKITMFLHNVFTAKVEWLPASGPPTRTIFAATVPNIANGYIDAWIAQSADQVGPQRCNFGSVGVVAYSASATSIANWMSIGGDITASMSAMDPSKPCRVSAAIYKLVFPQVTVE